VDVAGGRSRGERAGGAGRLAAVRRVPDEKAYLYEIIQTIGSGPDLETILRGIVRLVTEATDCHACLIFFVQDGRLVLRCASAPYAHLAGKASMAIGEGLGGWVAKTRRSAYIKENALQDPRVLYFPEFEEERFQSLVSVPVFARDGDVIGVVNLHAEAPHEFARADLDFLEHTASLVAGAVENARLYEEETHRVALLTDLSRLAQRIASASAVEDLLPMVAEHGRELLRASRGELHLLDRDERLTLRAASPARPGGRALDTRRLWMDALGPAGSGKAGGTLPPGGSPASLPEDVGALAEILWGDRISGTPMFAPLVVGEEVLGILAVVVDSASVDAQSVLSAVASHTAVALKQLQLIEWLKEKNLVKEFFEALAAGDAEHEELERAASRLGFALEAAYMVLHARPWSQPARSVRRRGRRVDAVEADGASWRDLVARLEARLVAARTGALFDRREASVRALIPVAAGAPDPVEAVRGAFDDLLGSRGAGSGAGSAIALSVGLSNACQGPDTFPRGFEEAQSAAEVGALLKDGPGVFTFDELGPYKYVLSTEEAARDRYQQAVGRLAEYDARRGAQLLHTLEGYLDGRGNVVGSSRALYIHPNTLRQRLSRIERVAGLDLESEDWLSLAIAVKVVKLRLLRRSASDRPWLQDAGDTAAGRQRGGGSDG
jgi:GAF domain-containing protein